LCWLEEATIPHMRWTSWWAPCHRRSRLWPASIWPGPWARFLERRWRSKRRNPCDLRVQKKQGGRNISREKRAEKMWFLHNLSNERECECITANATPNLENCIIGEEEIIAKEVISPWQESDFSANFSQGTRPCHCVCVRGISWRSLSKMVSNWEYWNKPSFDAKGANFNVNAS